MKKVTHVINILCLLFLISWFAAIVNVLVANTAVGFLCGLFVARLFLIAVIVIMLIILAGPPARPNLLWFRRPESTSSGPDLKKISEVSETSVDGEH